MYALTIYTCIYTCICLNPTHPKETMYTCKSRLQLQLNTNSITLMLIHIYHAHSNKMHIVTKCLIFTCHDRTFHCIINRSVNCTISYTISYVIIIPSVMSSLYHQLCHSHQLYRISSTVKQYLIICGIMLIATSSIIESSGHMHFVCILHITFCTLFTSH